MTVALWNVCPGQSSTGSGTSADQRPKSRQSWHRGLTAHRRDLQWARPVASARGRTL